MPIYKVKDKATGHIELVNAPNKARVGHHLAAKRFDIVAIGADETAERMAEGTPYSVASNEPHLGAADDQQADGQWAGE